MESVSSKWYMVSVFFVGLWCFLNFIIFNLGLSWGFLWGAAGQFFKIFLDFSLAHFERLSKWFVGYFNKLYPSGVLVESRFSTPQPVQRSVRFSLT